LGGIYLARKSKAVMRESRIMPLINSGKYLYVSAFSGTWHGKHADGLPDSLIPLSFSGTERKQSQPATVK
jgi:hypothetical protein